MKRIVVVVLGFCVGLLQGCRTPDRAIVPAAPEAEEAVRANGLGAGLTLHTGYVSKVALSGDGTVWGVRSRNAELELARWEDAAWKGVDDMASWPRRAHIVELAADPANPVAVLSVWKPRGDYVRTLEVRRHVAGEAAGVLLGEVENPTFGFVRERSVVEPQVTFDAKGGVWFTFKAPYLVHLPPRGGDPQTWKLPVGTLSEPERRQYSPLIYTPAGTGSGWVWAWIGIKEAKSADLMARPLLVEGGRLRNDYVLAGLPADAQVTLVARSVAQETIWAVENEGLWNVDLIKGTATRRSSPPGARIIDWCQPADGLEVAVVVPAQRKTDGTVTDIWIRNGGEWTCAGSTVTGFRSQLEMQSPTGGLYGWTWRDGMLFASQPRGLMVVDIMKNKDNASQVRTPDWREGFYLDRVLRILRLKDDTLMIDGEGGVVMAAPGSLRRNADAADRSGVPEVFRFNLYAARAVDGRVWYVHSLGEGAPMVRHWDGERWHEWPLPKEYQTPYASGGIWVDELGRVALFPKNSFDEPAWERDLDARGGWRRWPTGWLLIENRAQTPEKAANVPYIAQGSLDFPAISSDGRALVAHRGKLRLWDQGAWRILASYSAYTPGWRWGFEEDGRPWTVYNDKRHVFDVDGTRHETAVIPFKFRYETKVGEWPDWLSRQLDRERALAAHQDSDGVWWVLQDGELWRGWNGEVVQVFRPDETSPFRRIGSTSFDAVYVGRRGERLFRCNSPVLLPQLTRLEAPQLTWADGEAPADRRLHIEADGITHVEWQLNDGPWRLEKAGDIELQELAQGTHVLNVRLLNRRLEPGPILREEFRVEFDMPAHYGKVIQGLHVGTYAERMATVRRLSLMGETARPWLVDILKHETDDTRRWWLRAALQAIDDGLTNP